MKLEDLRWYDWLFILSVALWFIPVVEILTHIGIMVIFFYAMWLLCFLFASIAYIPIYIGYKIYRWKKKKEKLSCSES